MECHNHPDREAVANCSLCGKAVCAECSMEIGGNIYCKDCINEIITKNFGEKEAEESKAPEAAYAEEEIYEPITPIQAEEREIEEEALKTVEKAPENYETDYEYETEYVETYEEDGAEDSYYENPEPIPEPEPEYREQERKLKAKAKSTQPPIEPIHTGDIDEDYYYEPRPSETPSNELEAKYERYLEDLYYDEEEGDVVPPELLEEVEEVPPKSRAPKGKRRRKKQAKKQRAQYDEAPRRQIPREESGEYYINPRDEYEEDFIVPSHNRRRAPQRDAESYEELKRRIERNYELEQQSKKRGRFRRSKKSKYDYDDYELENIQEMHRYPVEEESEKLSIVEIILAIILIILIILLILYVIYLFRLSGDYSGFIEALTGLVQNPGEFINHVLN